MNNQETLKAICYIEGYMQHLLKMQGETMDEELNNKFKTVHKFIEASNITYVMQQAIFPIGTDFNLLFENAQACSCSSSPSQQ